MQRTVVLEPLEPLNLRDLDTVSDIVRGMSRCSFGARMLGEVADTLTRWIQNTVGLRSPRHMIVYDGPRNTFLGELLKAMVNQNWFIGICAPGQYVTGSWSGGSDYKNKLVVGTYPEHLGKDFIRCGESIFVNPYELVPPGLVQDGFFPGALFLDPCFAIPLLFYTLRERIDGILCTISEFVESVPRFSSCGRTDCTARTFPQLAKVFKHMVADTDCQVHVTISGAMTPAQMALVITDMIDFGMVQGITATGALMAHGLVNGLGFRHYKYNPKYGDIFLRDQKLNRITDTLEPESNLDHVEEVISAVLPQFDGSRPIAPYELFRAIGKYLRRYYPRERGILRSAYEKDIPIFVPAIIDSELGNDILVENERREKRGERELIVNPALDTKYRIRMKNRAKRIGVFTIGGGTPRNNFQNDAPLVDIMNIRLGRNAKVPKIHAGCRVAPDAMHFGHLGGSTLSEAGSWGKIDLERGIFAEVRGDATIFWPFCVKYVMDFMKAA